MIRKIYNVLAVLLFTAATAVAQDATMTVTTDNPIITNKKGEAYLPIADEWALGVSASPFLGYLGNFLSIGGGNDSPTFTYGSNITDNIAIFGKKMIDANHAYRVRFNVSVGTAINKAVVVQDLVTSNPDFPAFAEDWQKVSTTSVVIAPGYEFRRGTTRLQGIYGGELVIGLNSTKTVYQYGNSMTGDFPEPTTTDFGNNLPATDASIRVVEDKPGMNLLVGARAFVGVEYFFAPKMSIGGEFGYMFAWQTQRRGLTTTETFDAGTNSARQTQTDFFQGNGTTNIGVGIDNLSGSINLLFYF